jgi:hypothetical protein
MRNKFRDTVPRVTALMIAVVILGVAVYELALTRQYGAYLALESLFHRKQAVSLEAVSHHAQRLEGPLQSCRTDILDAVVSVSQRHVDQQFDARNGPDWLDSMRRMEPVVRDALACSPTNGDLWARLAILRWYLGGSAEEQIGLMTLSQVYAPAELAVVKRRLRHWRNVTRRMAMRAENLVRSDIRVMLLYAPAKDAAAALASLPPAIEPLFLAEERLVPQERREDLRRAGLGSALP